MATAAASLAAAAMEERSPQTMSLEEVRRSSLLAGIDVVLFFASSVVATSFWMQTRTRVRELRHISLDADTLAFRCLFLQLLSASNALRALGIIVDANLRLIFQRRHQLAWRLWFDYLISSLPTLMWSSMLSVLLLYLIEVYHKSQLKRVPMLRPTFAFLNAIFYLLYATIAALTLRLGSGPTYNDFRRCAYFLLACAHVLLAAGLLRFGFGLSWRLRRRQTSSALPKTQGTVVAPISRVTLLIVLLPSTEIVRTCNDLEYSLGGLPFNLHSGWSSVLFLATAKLFLEWVPSAAILCSFCPEGPSALGAVPSRSFDLPNCVDPLLPPGACDADALASPPRLGLAASLTAHLHGHDSA